MNRIATRYSRKGQTVLVDALMNPTWKTLAEDAKVLPGGRVRVVFTDGTSRLLGIGGSWNVTEVTL